jgi:hypothetical protein
MLVSPRPRTTSSEKCDMVATNADRVPQRTPLVAAVLIQPSSSSTTVDRDTIREDGPSALSSTKSQTHMAKVPRASTIRRPHLDDQSSVPTKRPSKEQVVDPCARPLKQ